ncbi:MAG: hypothetical protein U9R08_06155 [Nanoarchaeota archaeon]|nr:hypothetical protein [Nanoarchaeota archaeon]
MVNGTSASPTGYSIRDSKITKYIIGGLAVATLLGSFGYLFSGCSSSKPKKPSKLEQTLEFGNAKEIKFPTGKISKKGFRLYDVLGGVIKGDKHVEGTGSQFIWNKTTNKFSVRVAKGLEVVDKIYTDRACTQKMDAKFIGYSANTKSDGSGLHGTVNKYWRLTNGSEVSKEFAPANNQAYTNNLAKANEFFTYAKNAHEENIKNRHKRAIAAQKASADRIKAPNAKKPKATVPDRNLPSASTANTFLGTSASANNGTVTPALPKVRTN